MQEPIRVSTPKTILSSGMKSIVTIVTSAPAPKIRSPRFKGFRSKRQLKPARKMKVQHMLCCQT